MCSTPYLYLLVLSASDHRSAAIAQSNGKVRAALTDVYFVRRSVDATQAVADFQTLYSKVCYCTLIISDYFRVLHSIWCMRMFEPDICSP